MSLFSLIVSLLAYFATGQHAADGYALNVFRLATFTFFLFLLCLYVQSLGHLVGVLFSDFAHLAAVFAIVAYLGVSMLNGFFVNTEVNLGDGGFGDAVHTATNFVALKFISRGLVYAIYGIDRCAEDDEESAVLQFLNVDGDTVWSDCLWVLAYVIVLRVTTVALIYAKFSGQIGASIRRFASKAKNNEFFELTEKKGIVQESALKIEVDLPTIQRHYQPSSTSILIAWQNLTLFTSSSNVFLKLQKLGKKHFPVRI